jgi:hypothetical protein
MLDSSVTATPKTVVTYVLFIHLLPQFRQSFEGIGLQLLLEENIVIVF